MSIWLRRKITFTFPSETDGNKWPQNAIFRLSQMENNIYAWLGLGLGFRVKVTVWVSVRVSHVHSQLRYQLLYTRLAVSIVWFITE